MSGTFECLERCGVRHYCLLFVFFFQAEDGIRDLVRSRGLGDVYKRQGEGLETVAALIRMYQGLADRRHMAASVVAEHEAAVSYTHLTLPTSDLV